MAAIKYKGTDGQWHLLNNILVSGINVVQTTGSSSADVMSQSAVTEAINSKQDGFWVSGTIGLLPSTMTTLLGVCTHSMATWASAIRTSTAVCVLFWLYKL